MSDWTIHSRKTVNFEFAARRNESIQHITDDDDIWTKISKQIKDKKQFLNGFFLGRQLNTYLYVLNLYRSTTGRRETAAGRKIIRQLFGVSGSLVVRE